MPKDHYPPMHSAEHMLNQTMVRMFSCGRCIGAHIEKKKSRMDFRMHRDITPEEAVGIERRMNEEIRKDHPVTEQYLSRAEASEPFNLSRIPHDVGETIRVIRIGDYDACPCSGQHVASTKSIGTFKIVSTSYAHGLLRIRFRLIGATDAQQGNISLPQGSRHPV